MLVNHKRHVSHIRRSDETGEIFLIPPVSPDILAQYVQHSFSRSPLPVGDDKLQLPFAVIPLVE